jgi:hypothetical protein
MKSGTRFRHARSAPIDPRSSLACHSGVSHHTKLLSPWGFHVSSSLNNLHLLSDHTLSSSRCQHKCPILREVFPVTHLSELTWSLWHTLLKHPLLSFRTFISVCHHVLQGCVLPILFPPITLNSLHRSGHCLYFVCHSVQHLEGARNAVSIS